MRLSKIKLAGFKSFVDPTTVMFPSALTGVVGPNGCGKSNVIDAVRWVMGESSAKNLRGDSMTDVIFNGSNSRKPVGQASIELVFDNSDGTIGGQYANYNEISIKRTVSRDGQSVYYLNGTRCRRRDITDIFLGTGLGPRSYAIIEQGTISRLIEARPDEMRNFLEEAAGISKYKERRRETETRIRHTKENLERLEDLRQELDKQLAHLQRQARTAERYKEFKEQERTLKAQLQALRWHQLDQETHHKEGQIREFETSLEAQIAHQRSAEAEIEARRDAHVDATEAFNKIQSEYYGIGADIARLEQNIQHARERHQQAQNDLAQIDQAWNEAQAHQENDRRRIEQLRESLEQEEPALELATEAAELSAARLAEADEAMAGWQQQWEEFNQRAHEPSQTAQVERSRIQQFETQQGQYQQRLTRLEEEYGQLGVDGLQEEIDLKQEEQAQAEMHSEEVRGQLEACLERITQVRDENSEQNQQLDQTRTELQSKRGRHASLEALQQASLGKGKGAVSDWLAGQELQQAKRLAEQLEVEPDWAKALECVLGDYLEAVCVDGVDPLAGSLGSLEHGTVTLFESLRQGGASASDEETLLAKVRGEIDLSGLLNGVYTADTLEQALAKRASLNPGQSIITRDGVWLGPNWLRVSREDDSHSGVLHREQELKELEEQIETLQAQADSLQERVESGRLQQKELEQEREQLQRQRDEANGRLSDLRSQLGGKQARLEQIGNRREQLQQEMEENRAHLASMEEEMGVARERLHQALESMEQHAQEREELNARREGLRETLEQARGAARQDSDRVHQHTVRIQTLRTELSSTEQALERAEQQLSQLAERREELRMTLAEGDAPIQERAEELEQHLTKRMEVEERLGEARRRVEDIDHALRQLEGERTGAERKAQEIRSRLESLRMNWQELKTRRQTLNEQVTEAGFKVEAVLETLPEEAEIDDWQKQLNDLSEKIQRLGPINLAAIEEYETQSERKTYIDTQHGDLMEALDTLENAIRKIDRETRTRFKETFDQVNKGLQAKFPRLFGGGHAYLELTGEDLLDTGVAVMARPPGKRNSTIHLLSGGEKALTAVALVFAIFDLNPSPFCMLDEVDAPLDEANVGRFCSLVKEMSEHVQFIFITHNKTTMELSETLAGVTMHEPGVSRLVSVDVDEAVELAAV